MGRLFMPREFNTDVIGKGFDQTTIDKVWEKGLKYSGNNLDQKYVRMDICGTPIAKSKYGKQEEYGWEIDHVKPVAKGGNDEISNLQPLFWKNNRRKDDNYPWKR